jgi:hypothetical protein
MSLPAPHGDKLRALLANDKLPQGDRKRIEDAITRYGNWTVALGSLSGATREVLNKAIELLNDYRYFLDLAVIFDSPDDFLYRQKGQLKLDNTVVEEFLPYIVKTVFPRIADNHYIGPQSCYSALYFTSNIRNESGMPGIRSRAKDQDFTISKKVFIMSSFDRKFSENVDAVETNIGYLCAECKTNLDKTMFQEANATAHDVKTGVPAAKYLLLCEWLDMTPINTTGTDIDEVLILRKAKRLGSQVRSRYATRQGRESGRLEYERHLREHPFSIDVFARFLDHIKALLENRDPDEEDVLAKGFF